MKTYRDLIVWQKSYQLAFDIYRLTATFPPDERFGITAQLRRASFSVPSNIGEGYGRATRGEYLNHLSIARGSINEVEILVMFSEQLGYLVGAAAAPILKQIDEIQRMLTRLRSRLKGS